MSFDGVMLTFTVSNLCFYAYLQHTLSKLYIEILGLGKDSRDAQKLLNYRSPKSAKMVSVKFSKTLFKYHHYFWHCALMITGGIHA